MSGKQLDTTNIVNELKGSSLFFREDKGVILEEAAKDARTAPVMPAFAMPQPKSTSYPSSPLPPLPEPSQEPTIPSTPAVPPMSDFLAPQNTAAPPAVPEIGQSQESAQAPMVRPDGQRNERSNERRKVRHSFDILSDQLLALRELAVERERIFGKKVLLGDLVQQALDMFISKERNHD